MFWNRFKTCRLTLARCRKIVDDIFTEDEVGWLFWIALRLNLSSQGSISPSFYEQLFGQFSFTKKLQTQNVSLKKLHKTLKAAHKMLDQFYLHFKTAFTFDISIFWHIQFAILNRKWINTFSNDWSILAFLFGPICNTFLPFTGFGDWWIN